MRTRVLLSLALVSMVTFIVGCGGGGGGGGGIAAIPTAAAPAPAYGTVSGHIEGNGAIKGVPVFLVAVDSSAAPLAAVSTSVKANITGQFYSQLTSEGGFFQFINVAEGNYNVIAQLDRFNTGIIQNITVSAAVTAPVDLKLRLTPTGQIAGSITTPDKFNKSGVVAFVKGTSFSAFTDDAGNYLIYGVPVGTFTVGFNAAGLKQSVVAAVSVSPGAITTLAQVSMAIDATYFDPASPFGAEVASMYAALFYQGINYAGQSATSPVKFSHFTHVSQSKISCYDCHSGNANAWAKPSATVITSAAGIDRKTPLSMSDLYSGKFCGTCHNGSRAFDVKANCSKCHSGMTSMGPEVVFETTKVKFSHKAHVETFKKTCNECHEGDTPWKMEYKDKAFTMAQIWAGNGCGKCHGAGKVAFAAGEGSCVRCHPEGHDVVNPGEIGSDTCVVCHAGVVNEYQVKNIPSAASAGGTSHGSPFWNPAGHHPPSAAMQYGCSECHAHEAVFGKAYVMGLPTNRIHQITCQTCHWPTKAGGGSEHIARLRKDPDELCATCHHMRYTYGDNPPSTISSTQFGKPNNWSVLPLNDSGFPKLLTPVTTVTGMASITNPTAPSLEMKFWGANTQAIMKNAAGQASAGYAIYNLIYRGQLGGTTANPSGGNYPHDSPQYDLFRGKTGGTLVEFTKDLKGNTLTYNDSRPYNKDNACIVCHVRPEPEKGKFGHTFQGQEEGALEIYGPTFNQAQTEADVAALLATLHNMLDADDDGTLLWTRATKDADLKKALSSATGLTNASKLIMHGVAWNFFTIEGDSSEGIHNPEYAKSILNNCITIMNQLKDPTVSSDSAKITWY